MAKFLFQKTSFNRCRKERQGVGHCKNAKKTMETQIELTKTAVELARLDHRANVAKAENLRRPEREVSVIKQHSSFATVQKKTKKQFAIH